MVYHLLPTCFIICVILNPTFSDIFMHNPRGSNNRHNENTRERINANLNFDSQNNNRGGYNVGDDGSIYYYTKSILPIQWTNDHSCNDVNADCTLILQYTCDNTLRNGQGTSTIPVTAEGESNPQYRLTEDLTSHLNCRVRSRNLDLFTADQNLKGNSAIYTRQNPNGNRYGYECPEERDYYPHWQPNKWIDIAILTNRQDSCSYYRENSQNVQPRFACTFNNKIDLINAFSIGIILPNDEAACLAFDDPRMNGTKPVWMTFPSHDQPAPECYTPSYTSDNHLGDILGSEMPVYNWTLPSIPASTCVLRIRYNISTADYNGWNINSSSNGKNLTIMPEYFENDTAAFQRGYLFQNYPQVQILPDIDMKLQLAIDTARYSRVFQDRSYKFEIRQRKPEFGDKPIYNLNVRGRRGNFVQVFPAVEYDFVPNRLELPPNSYVHIQWIGSNTTPDGDGQGQSSTDRNNLLMLRNTVLDPTWKPYGYLNATGLLAVNLPEDLAQSNFLNLPLNDRRILAASGLSSDSLLNNAKAYFNLDARLVTVNSAGVYHYFSSRNNDFSNRDQKGQIIVQAYPFFYQLIGQNGYTAKLDNATVTIPEGSVTTAVSVKFAKLSDDQIPEILPNTEENIAINEKLFGNAYIIEPYDLTFAKNIQFQIPFQEFDGEQDKVDVVQFDPQKQTYLKLPSELDNDNHLLKFQSNIAGVYIFVEKQSTVPPSTTTYETSTDDTSTHETSTSETPTHETSTGKTPTHETSTSETPTHETSTGKTPTHETSTYETSTYEKKPPSTNRLWIVGVVIPVVLVLLVVSTIIYFRLNPEKYSKMKSRSSKTRRSVSGLESDVDMESFSRRDNVF